jgi:hypothetical protein
MICITKHITFLLSALILVFQNTVAQQNCQAKLKQAEDLFEEGILEEIPSFLEECIESGFTKEEKIRAYKLLIQTNLYEDNSQVAEQYLLELLKEEPEYELDTTLENSEFTNLYNKYRTIPVISIGIMGGLNRARPRITQLYTFDNITTANPEFYPSGMGIDLGVVINRYLTKKMGLNLGLWYVQSMYLYSDTLFDYAFVNMDETQSRLEIPITINYDLRHGLLIPYLSAGISFSYLMNARSLTERKYTDQSHADVTGPDITITSQRKPLNLYGVAGAGTRYKLNKGHLIFDVRYNIGLFNQVIPEKRYDNPELLYKYYYQDSDFTLNDLFFSVGYTYSFYSSKKNN